jgi:hypothetical protein
VHRILRQRALARCLKSVDIVGLGGLNRMNPRHCSLPLLYEEAREKKAELLTRFQMFGPSEEQYLLLTLAAKAAGIIDEIVPYEHESMPHAKIKPLFFPLSSNALVNPYETYLLDRDDAFHILPYG